MTVFDDFERPDREGAPEAADGEGTRIRSNARAGTLGDTFKYDGETEERKHVVNRLDPT